MTGQEQGEARHLPGHDIAAPRCAGAFGHVCSCPLQNVIYRTGVATSVFRLMCANREVSHIDWQHGPVVAME